MVAHLTMCTYGVNEAFRFVECIWLYRKSRQIQIYNRKLPILHHTCATFSELPSYVNTIGKIEMVLPIQIQNQGTLQSLEFVYINFM